MNAKEKVILLLEKLSGIDKISEQHLLESDLGMDSLGMVMLLIELEDTLEITLDQTDMNPYDLRTVANVIELAERYTGGANEKIN